MNPSPEFRKSSYSGASQDCVEVAGLPGEYLVRDTKNKQAGHLLFPGTEWAALLTAARTDRI